MEEVLTILGDLDWSPLWISLKTGAVATVLCFFLGVWAARGVLKLGPRPRAVIDGILTLPMVLPPTVAGFFLLLIFSLRRPFGGWLYDAFDIKVVQSWAGCVLAASVIAFPLMYRNARAAFEQVDVNLIYAGRTLGMSERAIFWRVVVPAAGPTASRASSPAPCWPLPAPWGSTALPPCWPGTLPARRALSPRRLPWSSKMGTISLPASGWSLFWSSPLPSCAP